MMDIRQRVLFRRRSESVVSHDAYYSNIRSSSLLESILDCGFVCLCMKRLFTKHVKGCTCYGRSVLPHILLCILHDPEAQHEIAIARLVRESSFGAQSDEDSAPSIEISTAKSQSCPADWIDVQCALAGTEFELTSLRPVNTVRFQLTCCSRGLCSPTRSQVRSTFHPLACTCGYGALEHQHQHRERSSPTNISCFALP